MKKLLLHSCCAPCSTTALNRLRGEYDLTVFYYNPNIFGREEFVLRLSEQKRLCGILNVPIIVPEYNNDEFIQRVSKIVGYEAQPEGGKRCEECISMRLEKTMEFSGGYDCFSTTLTVSPHKNAKFINERGAALSGKFMPFDFKKKDGYAESIRLSKEYNLYRQNFCGCGASARPPAPPSL